MASDGQFSFELYRYTPSLVAAIIFLVLFVLTTFYHVYQVLRTRCWFFSVFVVGGVCKLIQSQHQAILAPKWFL